MEYSKSLSPITPEPISLVMEPNPLEETTIWSLQAKERHQNEMTNPSRPNQLNLYDKGFVE